jgi:hypothetical protein
MNKTTSGESNKLSHVHSFEIGYRTDSNKCRMTDLGWTLFLMDMWVIDMKMYRLGRYVVIL